MSSLNDFDRWAEDPSSLMAADPVNLVELGQAIGAAFGEKREIPLLQRAIIRLIEGGKRPIFRDGATGPWEWTNLLYVSPDESGSETPTPPDWVAERVVLQWQAFGTGEVGQFWLGTHLPGAD